MSRKFILIFLLFCALILGGVFVWQKRTIFYSLVKKQQFVRAANVIEANNYFAIDYYSRLKDKDSNLFFSPFSISSAFAMVYEGAVGETANEIRSVFYFPENREVVRTGYASLFDEISKNSGQYTLDTANALWMLQDFPFSQDYIKNIENYYGGKAENLDFKNSPDESRVTINNWVKARTNNKITDLLPFGTVNSMTKLVLTNATYFKGAWVKQFLKSDTLEQEFRVDRGHTVRVPMMQRTDDDAIFNYFENSNLQILELTYFGDDLSMLLLLPKNNNLNNLENMLSVENIKKWHQSLNEQRVKVYIPKFKFETSYLMTDDLKAMGMLLPFSNAANFSPMTSTGKRELKIDTVIHKAFIEVGEEGTEAAAATAISMPPPGSTLSNDKPKTPVFRADHPFIFLIQQKNTGNILFMGRVVNPNL